MLKETHQAEVAISVVVASYNHAEYLRQRMVTLLEQDDVEMEVIVIDDKSTDNSREVLEEFRSDPRVKLVFNDENRGWVEVSNLGLSMSHGRYVMYANCDDVSFPTQIRTLEDALDKHASACAAYSNSYLLDAQSNIIGTDFNQRTRRYQKRFRQSRLVSAKEMTSLLAHECTMPNLSAVLFRKKALEAVGGLRNKYRVVADWELFFRLADGGDFFFVSTCLNGFRFHETTIRSSEKVLKVFSEYLELLYDGQQQKNHNHTSHVLFKLNFARILLRSAFNNGSAGKKSASQMFAAALQRDFVLLPFLFLAPFVSVGSKAMRMFAPVKVCVPKNEEHK